MNNASSSDHPLGINLANVDLNLLTSLHALLEERSVTAAAQRVGLSQPAMSHALRRIRRVFDDEILLRRGSTSVLTPKAEELLGPLTRHRATDHPATWWGALHPGPQSQNAHHCDVVERFLRAGTVHHSAAGTTSTSYELTHRPDP